MYPFREGDFAPRNGWYVAAFSDEIGDKLLSRWIVGEPVVLYRKADGTAVAVGGRCPHRYYPLGESPRVGDSIQCGYHGITFGPDGRCTRVPSQETVPGVYRIPSYPLVERGLWAFIWMGDADKADPALIPDDAAMGYGLPGFIYRAVSYMHVKGRYQLLNDNLLDLTHLGFLHGSSIGTDENASAPEERQVEGRSIRSHRWLRGAPIPPLLGQAAGYHGKIDRLAGMTFFAPGFHAGLDEAYAVDTDAERGGELLNNAKVFHAVTPGTRGTTHYFFAFGGTSEAQVDGFAKALLPVLDEDKFATEEIEKILRESEYLPPELMLKSDGTAVIGRRLLQEMMDQERKEKAGQPA
jgi:phenylpropionate dioxygenase-like ring-hydroxylating dioxygenase large terminal subunit